MSSRTLKRLGIILSIVTLILASVGFLSYRDRQQARDEQSEKAQQSLEGQPMGGRFATKAETETENKQFLTYTFSFTGGLLTLFIAVLCFHKSATAPDDLDEPAS